VSGFVWLILIKIFSSTINQVIEQL
jgi:hypothetical protein